VFMEPEPTFESVSKVLEFVKMCYN
jgi:hypothetical protein